MLPHTRSRLTGPPVALPGFLDRISERWWRTGPRIRLLTTIACVCLVLVAGVAHAASDPDGPPVKVWVATRNLLPGDVVTRTDLEQRMWPEALVPPGAVEEPSGTVTAGIPRGSIVTDVHLGDLGVAASVPAERVAVAIPVEQLPALLPGTSLDLVGPGPDGEGAVLTRAATVLADDGTALWVAVDREDAVAVSGAVAASTLAAVILPG